MPQHQQLIEGLNPGCYESINLKSPHNKQDNENHFLANQKDGPYERWINKKCIARALDLFEAPAYKLDNYQ